jgi:hypothetical protein
MTNIDWIIVLGLCTLGIITVLVWRRRPNVAAILMVVGVVALAIFVTAHDVLDFRARQEATRLVTNSSSPPAPSSTTPPPVHVPAAYPSFGPTGATGSAAPPAAANPYAAKPRPAPYSAGAS